jgi:streptomycin 6-kinase
MPCNLEAAARSEGRSDWLARLPGLVGRLEERWAIAVGPPFQPGGQTAWVGPARDEEGRDLVLKVMWRHPEAVHEADGLRVWAGDGAVLLHRSAELDDTIALLLERCRPGTPLAERPEPEQDEVVAGLLPRLWLEPPAGHSFRPLGEMCRDWADRFERKAAIHPPPLDTGVMKEGIALFRSLPDTSPRQVLLCTDLHAENVLAAERQPWLVIDPKPYVGDPTYDVLQHLLNCPDRLQADPVALAGRLAGLLDLDRERLLLWLFARCVQESVDWPDLAGVAARLARRGRP